ncbi:hypothetical protein WA158_007323 [Blastocystis sp. Blastoise]
MSEKETKETKQESKCIKGWGCVCKSFLIYILISAVVGYIVLTPQNPIFKIAYDNNMEMMKNLIENGGDVNVLDYQNNTALFWAAKAGNIDMINYLCRNGINVNAKNSIQATALHWAVFSNSSQTITSLIMNGLDPDSKDEDGNTPLHLACEYHLEESVKELLFNQANPNITNNLGNSPLHLVGKNCWEDKSCKAIVDEMKEFYADFSIVNKEGIPAIEVILDSNTLEKMKEYSKQARNDENTQRNHHTHEVSEDIPNDTVDL